MTDCNRKLGKTIMKPNELQSNLTCSDKIVGQNVWCNVAPAVAKDFSLMFAKCVVLSVNNVENTVQLKQIEPQFAEDVFVCHINSCWKCNDNKDLTSLSEIGFLPQKNIACVLDFLRSRYLKGHIYSTAEPLLVSINSYKDLGNTTEDWIKKYHDSKNIFKLEAHVFLVARKAIDNLHSTNKSQCIIVSGQSGSGKTEATKQIMKFFGAGKPTSNCIKIQKAVLAANPVLEAFGNAKTLHNHNSSRFGCFMQLKMSTHDGIQCGKVQNFFLEKTRIVNQNSDERNYHIFYQLIKGATPEMKKKLCILDCNSYTYINPKCIDLPNVDDKNNFKKVTEALESIGLLPEEIDFVYCITSGVLLLGNVKIVSIEQGTDDISAIDPRDKSFFIKACELMFLDPTLIEKQLTVKTICAINQKIECPNKASEAHMLKDSLSKAIYDKLFDWIVRKINETIKSADEIDVFIGILDIFGFELFEKNSFEQLIINITNEQLQKNFIDIVFQKEFKLYREENILAENLTCTDNSSIINLFYGKTDSVLSLLEDQCLAPSGSDKNFLQNCKEILKGNENFKCSKKASDTNFIIRHTIGDVEYCTNSFIIKNKDLLQHEIVEIIRKSRNRIIKELFDGVKVEKGKLAKGQLICSQFSRQLKNIMDIINKSKSHFIRCIIPNAEKKAFVWNQLKVLEQLRSLSILDAIELRNNLYSYRRSFSEFLFEFKFLNPTISNNETLTDIEKCRLILESEEISKKDWQIGKTMLFMKYHAVELLQDKQCQNTLNLVPTIKLIESLYLKVLYKRKLKNDSSCFVRLQSHIRRHLDMEVFKKFSKLKFLTGS